MKNKKFLFNINFYKYKISNFFEVTINLKDFKNKYENKVHEKVEKVVHEKPNKEKIAGRILSLRKMSKDLTFADLSSNNENLQIVFDNKILDENLTTIFKKIKRGYILGLQGGAFTTKTGQLSLLAENFEILSECQVDLPIMNRKDKEMLLDPEVRYSKRYLDLIVNSSHKEIFIFRAKLIQFLRNYLEERGFLEVETPMLNHQAGGALARPFLTHSNAIKRDLCLRIAPELYLKQLIISGYEKVFEIGKNFRNEDISVRHNPEFTSVEFYHSYSNYLKLMDFTKKFLRDLSIFLFNSEKIITKDFTLDFSEDNFKTFDVIQELELFFNQKINLNSKDEFYSNLEKLYEEFLNNQNSQNSEKFIKKNKKLSLKKKIDKLIESIIEPKCKDQPSFIMNHPTILSPLAKAHDNNKLISERFELFINGIEVINSYSELNDPVEQKERFTDQRKLNEGLSFDDEAHPYDIEFIEALSHGMPPTAGWGMGIDRMVMLFLGLSNIKEVILFPMMNVAKK
jgi:lysyl-tRNA synthetase class 2